MRDHEAMRHRALLRGYPSPLLKRRATRPKTWAPAAPAGNVAKWHKSFRLIVYRVASRFIIRFFMSIEPRRYNVIRIINALSNLHYAPSGWSCDRYERHALKTSMITFVLVLVGCILLGLATARPLRPFDELQPFTFYTGGLLMIIAFVCHQCHKLASAEHKGVWLVMCVGFAFLAADELMQIHENLDRRIHHLLGADPNHWLTNHLDDLLVLAYGAAGIWYFARHRQMLAGLHGFIPGVKRAGVCFVAMVLLDLGGSFLEALAGRVAMGVAMILEESFKALALCFLFVMFVVARFQLRRPDEARKGVRLNFHGRLCGLSGTGPGASGHVVESINGRILPDADASHK